jgi:alkanesulfonate monooxygenase SsuD/methylene tetrahydromethanopterin reductase-like flavin-dependent oxidoreductase (luciferase family)
MLNIIAKYADIWNLSNMPTPEEYGKVLSKLRKTCLLLGRDPKEIKNSVDIFVFPDSDKKNIQTSIKKMNSIYKIRGIIGDPSQCIKKIEEYISLGVSYFVLYFPKFMTIRTLEQIGNKIIPIFKDQ